MPLNLLRVSVGNATIERTLVQALKELGAPADEVWNLTLMAASPDAAWEVVLEGPYRSKSEHVDWEIVANGHGHFRKLFQGQAEHTVHWVRLAVRNLIWDGIRFGDNPIRSVDVAAANALEETVWQLLRDEEMDMVEVRFGVWREGPEEPRYVCKIEHETAPSPLPRYPWRWRSTLLRSPRELKIELGKALAMRRRERPAALAAFTARKRQLRAQPHGQPHVHSHPMSA
jgi:hypothetical protein